MSFLEDSDELDKDLLLQAEMAAVTLDPSGLDADVPSTSEPPNVAQAATTIDGGKGEPCTGGQLSQELTTPPPPKNQLVMLFLHHNFTIQ